MSQCAKCSHKTHKGICPMIILYDRPMSPPGNLYCRCEGEKHQPLALPESIAQITKWAEEEIALGERATAAPWTSRHLNAGNKNFECCVVEAGDVSVADCTEQTTAYMVADSEFIAHSRTFGPESAVFALAILKYHEGIQHQQPTYTLVCELCPILIDFASRLENRK